MVDAIIVRWIGGQKVPGYSANRIAKLLSPGSARCGPVSNGFAVAAGVGERHPQWARPSGLRGAAELCDVYCRKSSEMRFTEAAFSVAKTVLPSDLAM
jgi:hypothetical protein